MTEATDLLTTTVSTPTPEDIREKVMQLQNIGFGPVSRSQEFEDWLGKQWIEKVLDSANDRNTNYIVWEIIEDDVGPDHAQILAEFLAKPSVSGDSDRSTKSSILTKLIEEAPSIPEDQREKVVDSLKVTADNLIGNIEEAHTPWPVELVQEDLFDTTRLLLFLDKDQGTYVEELLESRSDLLTPGFNTQARVLIDQAKGDSRALLRSNYHTDMSALTAEPSELDWEIESLSDTYTDDWDTGSSSDTYNDDWDTLNSHAAEERNNSSTERTTRFSHDSETNLSSYTDRAVEIVQRFGKLYPKTTFPALNLHLYNVIRNKPEVPDIELLRELRNFGHLVQSELRMQIDPTVPTIGIEIEVFSERLPLQSIEAICLRKMGITVKRETGAKTELEIPPSTSAAVQARILYELKATGIVPSDLGFAPLHISLGFEKEWHPHDRLTATNIADLLTFASVPGGRVRRNNYNYAVYLHDSYEDDFLSLRQTGKRISRAQFRSPKVFGSRTYRLFLELQQVGKLLNEPAGNLTKIQTRFLDDVTALRNKYNIPVGASSSATDTLANALDAAWEIKKTANPHQPIPPNLIDESGKLMTKYAIELKKLDRPEKARQLSYLDTLDRKTSPSNSPLSQLENQSQAREQIKLLQEVGNDLLETAKVGTYPIAQTALPAYELFADIDTAQRIDRGKEFSRRAVVKRTSNLESLFAKEAAGMVPVYYFSYEYTPPLSNISLESDIRNVRLSSIHEGSNRKGKEYETVYYFVPKDSSQLRLSSFIHEENSELITQTKTGVDFAVRGYAIKENEGAVRSALYTTLQLSSWGMDSISIGGTYTNGSLSGLVVNRESLKSLPFHRAENQADPSRVITNNADLTATRDSIHLTADQSNKLEAMGLSIIVTKSDTQSMSITVKDSRNVDSAPIIVTVPTGIDNTEMIEAIAEGRPTPKLQEIGYQLPLSTELMTMQSQVINIDPEIDPDLNSALNSLLAAYNLQLSDLFLYGGVGRGQKRLLGDVDLLAVLDDDVDADTDIPEFTVGKARNPKLYAYHGKAISEALKGIDIHVISKQDYENPQDEGLRQFLNNIKSDSLSLWSNKQLTSISDEI